jgi:nucleoside-diphosphate-sugar epimerase
MTAQPIAVTGSTGYIASWIVRELLERGLTVHATVRDLSDAGKHQHLLEVAEDLPGSVEMFEADLLRPGSFDAAVDGCGVVIHAASPFVTRVKNPQRDLVDPAVLGTRNVLASVDRTATVTRVVHTSSIAAMHYNATDRADRRYSEADWNTASTLRDGAYQLSKTLGEKEAWTLAEAQDRWRLVVINPGFALGPALSPRTDGTSVSFVSGLLTGANRIGLPDMYTTVVDVREVATAHVEAALRPDAEGRHAIVADVVPYMQVAQRLHDAFPDRPLPHRALPTPLLYLLGPLLAGFSWSFIRHNLAEPFTFDNTRSQERLGITYRPLTQTLRDQGQQLMQMHLA